MNLEGRWQGILSICRKAGKLRMGLDPAKTAVYNGEAAGLLTAADVSPRSRKEARYFAQQAQIEVLEMPLTMAELGFLIGRSAGVYAVCDEGFFKKMRQLAAEIEDRNRLPEAAGAVEPQGDTVQ